MRTASTKLDCWAIIEKAAAVARHGDPQRRKGRGDARRATAYQKKLRGSEFGPPLPLGFRCVWNESLQDAQDICQPNDCYR